MGNGCMKKQKVVEVKSPTLPAFKIVVVGDSGSGKSSVIRRFVENRFEYEYKVTTDVGITSVVKKLNVPENAIVAVELWDIPGQNDVDLRKAYYLDVDAVIVVIDISQEDSLNVAGSWSLDVAEHARVSKTFTENIPNPDGKTFAQKIRKEYQRPKVGSIPILLLGNKYDLAKLQYLKQLDDIDRLNGVMSQRKIQQAQDAEKFIEREEVEVNHENRNTEKHAQNANDGELLVNGSTDEPEDTDKSSVNGNAGKSPGNGETGQPNNDNRSSTNGIDDHSTGKLANEDYEAMTSEASPEEVTDGQGSCDREGNSHVPNDGTALQSGSQMKELHPGDIESSENPPSVTMTTPNGHTNGIADDARSAVTMTTSVVSILPPCVEEIDHVAEKFGFIAGVPVSAKTANGGVPEAIQSVLRRLVGEKILKLEAKDASLGKLKASDVMSMKSGRSGRSKTSSMPKKNSGSSLGPLQEVGIIEIDEVIRRCNPIVHEAEELTTSYAEAVQSFKMACSMNGFTRTTRVSLEACVSSLKEAIENDATVSAPIDPRENVKLLLRTPQDKAEEREAWSLIATDGEDFPSLTIVNSRRQKVEEMADVQIDTKIMTVLSEYHEKLYVKSIAVIKQGGDVSALLTKLTSDIAAQEEKAWETAVAAGLKSDEVKRILSTLAQDKARLRGTADLIRDAKRSAHSSIGKIKAALLF